MTSPTPIENGTLVKARMMGLSVIVRVLERRKMPRNRWEYRLEVPGELADAIHAVALERAYIERHRHDWWTYRNYISTDLDSPEVF